MALSSCTSSRSTWLSPWGYASFLIIFCAQEARADQHLFKNSPSPWLRDVTLSGLLEGGITANPARPHDGVNFGNFISDRANQAQINQLELTLEKANDPTIPRYQIGFTLEGMYGSDPRYFHLLGVSNKLTKDRYQLVPAQAHVNVHLPILTKKGLDLQAGILQTPMGVEPLDPSERPFYTLTYISQYSAPVEHLGAMAYWHLTHRVDLNFGIDSGNQTTFGHRENHGSAAGYVGFTLNNLAHGKLTIVELSRIGPENTVSPEGTPHKAQRYWNDIAAYLSVTKRLSLTGEFNFLRDNGMRTNAWGLATFLSYKLSPTVTFNYRGELYRDSSGNLVGSTTPQGTALPTTFGALSLGFAYKPDLGHGIRVFEIHPEIRFDRSLNGRRIFNDRRNIGMFTFGGDMMIGF